MIKNNNEKQFDCIIMKSNIQKQIYNETKNMTTNELLRYFNGNGRSTKAQSRRPAKRKMRNN